MSLISSRVSKDPDALAAFYRSAGPNNKSEDQFGGQEQKVGGFVKGEAGIIGENCVVGNDLGHSSL